MGRKSNGAGISADEIKKIKENDCLGDVQLAQIIESFSATGLSAICKFVGVTVRGNKEAKKLRIRTKLHEIKDSITLDEEADAMLEPADAAKQPSITTSPCWQQSTSSPSTNRSSKGAATNNNTKNTNSNNHDDFSNKSSNTTAKAHNNNMHKQ